MTDIALSAGFQSLRRFNALFKERYGLAPTAIRQARVAVEDNITLRLDYRPPLHWPSMLSYLKFRITPGMDLIQGDEYVRTVQFGPRKGWLRLGLGDRPNSLAVTVPLSLAPVLGEVLARVRQVCDLDAHPQAIDAVLGADPVLRSFVEARPGLRVPGAWSPFELASRTILGQQVSVAGANTLMGRLAERFGDKVETPWPELKLVSATAESVAAASIADLARVGMPGKRAEGLRALVQYTATWQDKVMLAHAGDTTIDLDMAERMNDLLLPIVKGVGSERAYEVLAQSLQTYGGSGYLQDYPLEQYIRDSKIDTLYEGTTAIQGLDFFFRKMVRDQFKAVFHLAADITETVKGDAGQGQLAAERELLGKALEDVQGMIGKLGEWAMASQTDVQQLYLVGLNSTRLLMSVGDLVLGWLLVRQAEVALAAIDAGATGKELAFYQGKVASATWFAHNRLPLLAAERAITEATDLSLMELDENAF